MSTQGGEHGGHDEGAEIHLPDPSVWPLVVGFTVFLLGAAIIFWSRDRNHAFAGPLVGAALLANLFAAAGWAWQDSIMRRKATSGEHGHDGSPRFSQVVTFAIAEGQLQSARAESGVLSDIERSDLRDLAGFQDLRIQVSPAEVGPSQVLVETTWSGRESLPTYEETRQTLLDRIAAHDAEIVPGSVQVFDMDVVRDTKDTSFRFSLGAAATVFGGLLVGGLMVGAGLSAFQESHPAAAGGGGAATPPPAADPYHVVAKDSVFVGVTTLKAPPNTEVTFTLENQGKQPHNLSFGRTEGGNDIAEGPILPGGQSGETKFTTPAAGSYFFVCEVHPTEMRGTFEVTPDAPAPGAAPAAGGGGEQAGGNTVNATDNKFDVTTLTATAGQPFSVTLNNKGKVPHNISFYTNASASQLVVPEAEGGILQGGKSETLTFTPPTPGEYIFHCDLHPTEMKGTFTVK